MSKLEILDRLSEGGEDQVTKVVAVDDGDVAKHLAELAIDFIVSAGDIERHLDVDSLSTEAFAKESVKSELLALDVNGISLWIEIDAVIFVQHDDSHEKVPCHRLKLGVPD